MGRQRPILSCILVSLLFIVAPRGFAIGLGSFHLYSALNEPLDAEIEVLQAQDMELETLSAQMASDENFKKAGLPLPHGVYRFELKRFKNLTFIHITSDNLIDQPFLDFLVQLYWPSGRLVRAYNVLLDLPTLTTVNEQAKRLSDVADESPDAPGLADLPVPIVAPLNNATTSSPSNQSPAKPALSPSTTAAASDPSIQLSPQKVSVVQTEDITQRINAYKPSASEFAAALKVQSVEEGLKQLFEPDTETELKVSASEGLAHNATSGLDADKTVRLTPPVTPMEPHSESPPVAHTTPNLAIPAPVTAEPPETIKPSAPAPVVHTSVAPAAQNPSALGSHDVQWLVWLLYLASGLMVMVLLVCLGILWQRRHKGHDAGVPVSSTAPQAPVAQAATPLDEVVAENLEPSGGSTQQLMNEMFLKLELARGYLGIDDREHAVEALHEVLAKGDEGQRQAAQTLLDSLS